MVLALIVYDVESRSFEHETLADQNQTLARQNEFHQLEIRQTWILLVLTFDHSDNQSEIRKYNFEYTFDNVGTILNMKISFLEVRSRVFL